MQACTVHIHTNCNALMSSLDFKKINMDGGQIQIMQQEKAIFANTGVSFTFFQSILIFHVQRIKNESYMA